MSKTIKYIIGVAVAFLIIFLSLDIQNLEKYKAARTAEFNASDYAQKFWNDSLPHCIANAAELSFVMQLLNDNPDSAFENYGHKLGISKTYYFLVKGKGIIEAVNDESLEILLVNQKKIEIATDFIFGNAVRDGSGKVNINDFLNMTDFNDVSVAINKLVKEKVVSRLRNSAAAGKNLEFAGALEIRKDEINLSTLFLIPVSVKLSDGQTE